MTEKIALLTDSACDLPSDFIKEHNIKILPLKVIYNSQEQYSDRVDISPEEVYGKMPQEVPTTSMPALEEIKSALLKIREEGFTHVLAVHISSGLSGTAQAVEMIAQEITNLKIKVFDSKTLSMGTGWLVLQAARYVTQGVNFNEIIKRLHTMQPKIKLYYVIETLEYLRRGGRIGQVASILGEFFQLKPIISVNEEGKYFTFCKAKGRLKSIEKLIKLVEEACSDKPIHLAVLHGGAWAECEKMLNRIRKFPNIKELIVTDISPVLGVHTGPGLLGICFYENK